jgi:hypothetical protein
MRKLYVFILLLVFAIDSNAQMWQWEWAKKYTTVTDPYPERMVKHNDHLVITGHYTNTTSDGIFVMMVDTMGNLVWTQTFDFQSSSPGGLQTISPSVIVYNNNIYIAPNVYSGTFQVGSNTFTNTGAWQGYVIKMDLGGNVVWAEEYGGSGNDMINDLVEHNGQLYMLAQYEGTAMFGTQSLTATGGANNMLIATLDAATGNVLTTLSKDVDMQGASRLRFTSNDEYIIFGRYRAHVNADAAQLTTANAPSEQNFLLMLNSSGVGQWAQQVPLTGLGPSSLNADMELDAADSIYIDNNGGSVSYFYSTLQKYSFDSPSPSWAEGWNNTEYGGSGIIGDIEISGADVYIAAVKKDPVISGNADDDVVKLGIFNYSTTGTLLWADSSVWTNRNMIPAGLVKGAGNELYVLSSFSDTLMVDTMTLTSPNTTALMVAKIGLPVVTGVNAMERNEHFDVYPNPSNGIFTLKGELSASEATVIIRNMHGQIVHSNVLSLPAGGFVTTIQTTGLANGIYSMELVNGNYSLKKKLVITNK